MEQDTTERRLELHGGIWGGLVPLFVLVGGLVWLSVEEMGGTKPFWACGWMAIVAGLFFAKDKKEYCNAAMRGIGDKTGIVIITAWLFAGVFGKLMVAGGLVDGLLWLGMTTGAQGSVFVVMVFAAAALFALGTGTSTGTCIALAPVLYPAGCFLGADPALLATAILSGAAFGDNLAPISDTTIVSAFTQGATMRDVVRSRFPLAMVAATFAIAIFLIFGGGGTLKPLPELQAQMNPSGALMLLALLVVVGSALSGRHIIESLIYGNITAGAIGVITGNLKLSAIFHIPEARGVSTGIIQNGINGVVGAIIFALLILAVTQILVESGIMARILRFAEKFIINSVRQAELSIIGVTILASIPISANAPAELLVGPSLVKPIGEKFNLAPARRANLMDCAVCTIFFILPWHIVVAAWYAAIVSAAEAFNLSVPSISAALLNPYSWALFATLVFSAVTGWNRAYAAPDEEVLVSEESCEA
ncbi:Na+/H+ antiporter NhaC family protein [Desulfobaculum bizertense]|uniref:Transporter, NhaC family n=1 Tax=Desulfobaculum bizertense DSM 18034 TaxID=1121442 RepID=A0A1T4VSV8_9BACT|nr:Na+/H+ antiporter NhaC family protein [Desulfobaculum bizertense]UIJ38347.1 sodium:proton antiporter [Desulfobaculum bizertense]SKA67591.1 transporter, NhaC family [Desulfobaculum bizertense DSM 18034]